MTGAPYRGEDNAGKKAGVDSILEYLIETLQNLGKAYIDTSNLFKLSIVLYDLLEPHISQNLSAITSFSQIMREYIENGAQFGWLLDPQ